ncbi:glycosyltransferase family 1 protein [Actinoplanes sp. NPDC049668]|uniref:glycosyltransferase family 1 protein n=1 Tax=unclassified Actinoplanes TaxID=2626549 RepID=UPI0033A7601E
MTEVLIVTNWIPGRPTVLADTVQQLHDSGVRVTIVSGCDPEKISVPEGTATLHGLPAVKSLPRDDRAEYKRAVKGRKLWLRARADRKLRRLAGAADVLVALDANALHTVWQLSRRYRASDAVVGLAPALAAVARRAENPSRYARRRVVRRGPSPVVAVAAVRERADRLVDKVARRGSGRRVLGRPGGRRAWELLLDAPGLGDTRRIRWGEQITERLLAMGLPDAAGAARIAATRRLHARATKAEWLREAATAELEAGRIPVFLREAAAAELDLADKALARDDLTEATRSVSRIIPLLFNRAVHFDSLESPSAKDPAGFLAPLHRSKAGQALVAPRGRRTPAVAPPGDRPHRLLFLTRANEYFLGDIRERYDADPRFEVRRFSLLDDEEREPLSRQTGKLVRHLLAGNSEYGDQVREWFAPHIEWADTIFVDWCLGHAAMLTTVDPGSTRIIVRLHSYEAFTVFPHLIDMSRVDDLVFVSEPLREFTLDVAPRLREPGAPRTPVITNAVKLDRYRRPKADEARFNLGLVGLSAIAKDPLWAFEVLRELRRRDDRYKLVLIGKEIDGSPNATAAAYHRRFAAELEKLEGQGAVRRVGQTDDVPAALTDVGVILSTSVRESFHLGLIEGAASGAVPVVRDWPFFAGGKASARSIFPSDWIVTTPQAAADRIMAQTATDESWRKAGEAAAAHAMITWDWSVTQAEYDRLLLS